MGNFELCKCQQYKIMHTKALLNCTKFGVNLTRKVAHGTFKTKNTYD